MQIRKGLYHITGAAWGSLGEAYCLTHSEGYVLIDMGSPGALKNILENMDYWGIDASKVTHVLITHGHDDHVGDAYYFKNLGAKIVVGASDAPMLEAGNLGIDSPCTNHKMPPCKPDILIEKDCKLTIGNLEFEILSIPGHTNGTLLYLVNYNSELILFGGDMFNVFGKWGEDVLTGWKGDLSYSSEKMVNSFARLYKMNYKPDLVLCGHGIPRFGRDVEVIRQAYAFCIKNDR